MQPKKTWLVKDADPNEWHEGILLRNRKQTVVAGQVLFLASLMQRHLAQWLCPHLGLPPLAFDSVCNFGRVSLSRGPCFSCFHEVELCLHMRQRWAHADAWLDSGKSQRMSRRVLVDSCSHLQAHTLAVMDWGLKKDVDVASALLGTGPLWESARWAVPSAILSGKKVWKHGICRPVGEMQRACSPIMLLCGICKMLRTRWHWFQSLNRFGTACARRVIFLGRGDRNSCER